MKSLFSILILLILVISIPYALADYKIERDGFGADAGGASGAASYSVWNSLGQFSSGESTGSTNKIYAGSIQPDGTFINMDVTYPSGSEVEMSSISGLTSGQIGNGYANVNVTTDYNGYTIEIKSSTAPALKCDTNSGCEAGDSFADYTPSGGAGTPDYDWGIANAAAEFGFTAKGADIVSRFKYDTGNSTCGGGSTSVSGDYCWDALTTSSGNAIAEGTTYNYPVGTTTRVKFRSQIGSSAIQPSGDYKATITLTAFADQL